MATNPLTRFLVFFSSLLLVAASGCGGDDDAAADAQVVYDAPALPDALPGDGGAADASDIDGGGSNDTAFAYYWGDFETDQTEEVGMLGYPSGTTTRLTLSGLTGGEEIEGVAVSPDGSKIAVVGRNNAGDAPVINVYDADGTGAPTTVHTGTGPNDFEMLAFSPDGTRLAFLSDIDQNNTMAVYVLPAAGGVAPKLVSPDSDRDVYDYAWAPSSTHIAFAGPLEQAGVTGLWTVDVTEETPAPDAIVTLAELTDENQTDRDVASDVAFDSDGKLYFRSDFEVENDLFRIYRCNIDGTSREHVAGTDLMNNEGADEASVGTFGISPDGSTLAFASESPEANLYQVYVMPLAGSDSTVVSDITATPPESGSRGPSYFAPIVWSPDGTKLAVSADWPVEEGDQDDYFSAFILPTSAPAGGVRVLKMTVAGGDIDELGFTSDSSALVVRAEAVTNNDHELFATTDFATADETATDLRVVGVPDGGDVWGLTFAP